MNITSDCVGLDIVILPEDKQYEQARKVWNDCIDRYPCLIVKARFVIKLIWIISSPLSILFLLATAVIASD